MERELPAGLSDAQRWVLLEFFKGHIPAGQLTKQLGIDARAEPERHLFPVAAVPPEARAEHAPRKSPQSGPSRQSKDNADGGTGAAAA